MKNSSKEDWINQGYSMVARDGFNHLTVQALSRSIGKNKSSFYHYFGDMALFEAALFEQHIHATNQFAHAVSGSVSFKPDILNQMIKFKDDMFFHKQLRINRDKPSFKACFEQSYALFQSAILDKWVDFLGMNRQKILASTLLNLASENFLLRITYDSFNYQWLEQYLSEYSDMLKRIKDNPSF